MRWYPKRRYTALIDSSTWSRTATLAGSRSLVPRAGLLAIFTEVAFLRECRVPAAPAQQTGVHGGLVVWSAWHGTPDATTKY